MSSPADPRPLRNLIALALLRRQREQDRTAAPQRPEATASTTPREQPRPLAQDTSTAKKIGSQR